MAETRDDIVTWSKVCHGSLCPCCDTVVRHTPITLFYHLSSGAPPSFYLFKNQYCGTDRRSCIRAAVAARPAQS